MQSASAPIEAHDLDLLLQEVNTFANKLRWLDSPHTALPSGERAVLQCLAASGAQTVPEIAKARGTSRQNTQILVNRLRKKQLIELVPNPARQKSPKICLNPEGIRICEAMSPERSRCAEVLRGVCTREDLRKAAEVLAAVRQALVKAPAASGPSVNQASESSPQLPAAAQDTTPTTLHASEDSSSGTEMSISML